MARIYVIDDDDQLLRMVGLMLERGGHIVTTINNPVKGLEQVKADKPDLLVCDVMMPGMSGHDVTRQIRGTDNIDDLPILILTARSQEIDRTTALKSGANDYLSKPVTSRELLERVDNLLTQQEDEMTIPEKGMVIAVYGLRGGAGRTTIAVNLATALRRLSQQEVCLFDSLSPSGSQCAMHVRLAAKNSWEDLTHTKKLDWPTIQQNLTKHPSGMQLLAAPQAPQLPTTPTAKLTKLILSSLQENTLFTVVDLPSVFSASFRAGLEMADLVLHVLTPEVVAVQTAVQVSRTLAKSGMTFRQKSYILNQISPEAQLPLANVERGLGSRIPFHINYDPNQTRALAQGVPLALTSATSPIPTITRRMAEVIWQRVTKTA